MTDDREWTAGEGVTPLPDDVELVDDHDPDDHDEDPEFDPDADPDMEDE